MLFRVVTLFTLTVLLWHFSPIILHEKNGPPQVRDDKPHDLLIPLHFSRPRFILDKHTTLCLWYRGIIPPMPALL